MGSSQTNIDKELRRALSIGSLASPEPRAEPHPPFRKIGAGACGAIFAQDGKPHVFKLAKCSDGLELMNDSIMHQRIAHQFEKYNIEEVRIPDAYFFLSGDTACKGFWDKHDELRNAAANDVNLPTAVLCTERILPLPSTTRELLIEKYCPPMIKEEARAAPANKDCLVRVYLGSTKGKMQKFFSLRNFKLHLNHMVDLELDIELLARRMGRALAVMHWAAKTDARDVEFVLGGSTMRRMPEEPDWSKGPHYTGPPSCLDEDFFGPVTELFVLDFNQVREITMDDAGVAMAVEAWRLNDPYYPKPRWSTEAEWRVWLEFVNSYLAASKEVLGDDMDLPHKFLSAIRDEATGESDSEDEKGSISQP